MNVQDNTLILDDFLSWTRCHNVQDKKLSWMKHPGYYPGCIQDKLKIDRLTVTQWMVVPLHTKRQFYLGRVQDKVVPKHTKRQFYPGCVQDKEYASRIRIVRPG